MNSQMRHHIVTCAGKTHRQLFDMWIQSMLNVSASDLIATGAEPAAGKILFEQMCRDISSGGQVPGCPVTHASYAMGYNLAIEYMADFEKRWMLESFRSMDQSFMAAQGCKVDWVFLEVRFVWLFEWALSQQFRRFLGVFYIWNGVPCRCAWRCALRRKPCFNCVQEMDLFSGIHAGYYTMKIFSAAARARVYRYLFAWWCLDIVSCNAVHGASATS
jgi:hypothetical protein